MRLCKRKRKKNIEVEDVLIDASNVASFDRARLEGRIELPISRMSVYGVGVVFALIALVFLGQAINLQVFRGDELRAYSEENRIDSSIIFAERGVIYDRTGARLVWNTENEDNTDFAGRSYAPYRGLGQLLGYVRYPKKDTSGFYFRTDYEGVSGIEEVYDDRLSGDNGRRLIEIDASQQLVSSHAAERPQPGDALTLSIDAELSEVLYDAMEQTAEAYGFRSGGAAIMDVRTGEIIALANYPSYDPGVLADGKDAEAIAALTNDERQPFLNRIMTGLYTPGSVVKPFVAYAALHEDVITPEKTIVSTGSITIPNPYNPSQPSVFNDWKAHGEVDMRRAIAVSSNVYFYEVGGGYKDQEGLGIDRLYAYFTKFGFGQPIATPLSGGATGTVPNPEWKKEVFDDVWRLGDTYFTAIGQFGFQVTPLQLLRAYAALANGGTLLTPHFGVADMHEATDLDLDPEELQVVREGLRLSAHEGTARSLNHPDVVVAGKTGTAQVGAGNAYINSWTAGYFPYAEPRYAFVMLLEHGPEDNLFGAAPTMRGVLDWLVQERPEYVGLEDASE